MQDAPHEISSRTNEPDSVNQEKKNRPIDQLLKTMKKVVDWVNLFELIFNIK
jgi:hypothetical protein